MDILFTTDWQPSLCSPTNSLMLIELGTCVLGTMMIVNNIKYARYQCIRHINSGKKPWVLTYDTLFCLIVDLRLTWFLHHGRIESKLTTTIISKLTVNVTYFYVKPVDPDAKIVLIFHILLSSVELFTFVNILATSSTTHIERSHEPDSVLAVFSQFHARDLRRIEIRGIVFLKS